MNQDSSTRVTADGASVKLDWKRLHRSAESRLTPESLFGSPRKEQGSGLLYFCPFHDRADQKDPSAPKMHVDPITLGWKCWHSPCGRKGDALSFVAGGISPRGSAYFGAVADLCAKAGLHVPPANDPSAYRSGIRAPDPDAEREARRRNEERRRKMDAEDKRRSERARELWDAALPVPNDPSHPARLWISASGAKPGVWNPSAPFPASIRWLPPTGAGFGALICPFARIADWLATWPEPPAPIAVHLIYIDGRGGKAYNETKAGKRLDKQSFGSYRGCGILIAPQVMQGQIYVVEGVADALAASAWIDGSNGTLTDFTGSATAFAMAGTASFGNETIAADLIASKRGIVICGDGDGPGREATAKLMGQLSRNMAPYSNMELPRPRKHEGSYDMADFAGHLLADLESGELEQAPAPETLPDAPPDSRTALERAERNAIKEADGIDPAIPDPPITPDGSHLARLTPEQRRGWSLVKPTHAIPDAPDESNAYREPPDWPLKPPGTLPDPPAPENPARLRRDMGSRSSPGNCRRRRLLHAPRIRGGPRCLSLTSRSAKPSMTPRCPITIGAATQMSTTRSRKPVRTAIFSSTSET